MRTQKLRRAIDRLVNVTANWRDGIEPYEHVQVWRDCVVIEAEELAAAHVASERAAAVAARDAEIVQEIDKLVASGAYTQFGRAGIGYAMAAMRNWLTTTTPSPATPEGA